DRVPGRGEASGGCHQFHRLSLYVRRRRADVRPHAHPVLAGDVVENQYENRGVALGGKTPQCSTGTTSELYKQPMIATNEVALSSPGTSQSLSSASSSCASDSQRNMARG